MAERSTITQVVQLGLETTAGTMVAATKRLQATDFSTDPQFTIEGFRPAGFKFNTVTATEKEWVEVGLKGQPTYTEIIYLMASLMGIPAAPTVILNGAAADTGGRKWIFEPNTSTPDTPQTFTVEQGSSVRAHKFGYGLVTELGISFTRDKNDLTGKMLGQAITDGITMSGARSVADGVTVSGTPTVTSATAKFVAADVGIAISGAGIPANSYIGIVNSPTSIGLSSSPTTNTPVNATASASGVALTIASNVTSLSLVPITASQITCYLDTTSGALGTTKIGRLFSGAPMLGSRYNPVWVVDASLASWVAHVETPNDATWKMVVEADAAGMAFLTTGARTNQTYFLRMLAQGPVIYNAAAPYTAPNDLRYSFQWDMAVQINNVNSFSDQQGVYAIGFDFLNVYDAGWNKAQHLEVINKITAMT